MSKHPQSIDFENRCEEALRYLEVNPTASAREIARVFYMCRARAGKLVVQFRGGTAKAKPRPKKEPKPVESKPPAFRRIRRRRVFMFEEPGGEIRRIERMRTFPDGGRFVVVEV